MVGRIVLGTRFVPCLCAVIQTYRINQSLKEASTEILLSRLYCSPGFSTIIGTKTKTLVHFGKAHKNTFLGALSLIR